MRSAALLSLLLLPLQGSAHAEKKPLVAEPGGVWVTLMGRHVLVRADVVVEAEILSVRPAFRGVSTAQIQVGKRWFGRKTPDRIVLLFVEDYRAPEAFRLVARERRYRPPTPGVKEAQGRPLSPERDKVEKKTAKAPGDTGSGQGVRLMERERGLFFLRRRQQTYSLVAVIHGGERYYASKKRRLQDVFRLEARAATPVKVKRAKTFYMGDLRNRDLWLRSNSAREVAALARRFPDVFQKQDVRYLAAVHSTEKNARLRGVVESAIRSLDPELYILLDLGKGKGKAGEAFEKTLDEEAKRLSRIENPSVRAAEVRQLAARYKAAATRVLAAQLRHPKPVVRIAAAQALAEHGGSDASEPLRGALLRESHRETAAALVAALGERRDPKAVSLIENRLSDPKIRDAALRALARIWTPQARASFRTFRENHPEMRLDIRRILREEGRPTR